MKSIKNKFKKIKYYIFEPDLDKQSNIRFIHNKPKFGNIGDDLCSPKHYFDFHSKQRINIIGGGIYDIHSLESLIDIFNIDALESIVWGVGQSKKNLSDLEKIDYMPFPFWGVRDIDSVKNENFLPCVSCLNSFLDIRSPKNKKTLYFLNYDKNITSNKLTSFLLENYKGALLFNNCTKKNLLRL